MKIPFNLNNYIEVQLTDFGRQKIRENFEKLQCGLKYEPPKEDRHGWSSWQAWEFIREVSPHFDHFNEMLVSMNIRVPVKGDV